MGEQQRPQRFQHCGPFDGPADSQPPVQMHCLAYLAPPRLPVLGCPVVLVGARFPISILPRVITELWRVPQLLLGDICSETTKRRIICQSAPGYGIMAVA